MSTTFAIARDVFAVIGFLSCAVSAGLLIAQALSGRGGGES